MHAPPAAHETAAPRQAEALAAELTRLLRVRGLELEVLALRDLLAAGSGDAACESQLKEIVRLLSEVIMFRAGLARE